MGEAVMADEEQRAEQKRLNALADKHGVPRPNRYTPSAMGGGRMSADDDRRAQIEAVAEALWLNNRLDGKPQGYPYERLIEPTRADLQRLAEAAIAALDRVRDARGDDEPQGVERELLRTIDQQARRISEQEDRIGNLLGELAARSPQG
jgi:hypothetical protein